MEDISRRTFLTGAAATTMIVAGTALAGSAFASESGSASASGSASGSTAASAAGSGSASGSASATSAAGSASKSASAASAAGSASASTAVSVAAITGDQDCDVLIVGCGAAGMMAAYEAGNAGVQNILVISNSETVEDVNGSMVSGTAAVQTKWTEDAGETETIQQLYDHMIDFAHWTSNARLLKTCVEYLPDNVDILANMGIDFELGADRYSIGFKEVHLFKTDGKGTIIQKYLEDNFGVKFMFGTEATAPIMDGDACVGIQATDSTGTAVNITAKAVCLACGGYIDNPDMLASVYGDMPIVACSAGHQKGAGVQIAMAAGAFPESTYGLGMNDIFGSSEKVGFTFSNPLLGLAFYGGLVVNQNGERFMNEYMLANASMGGGGEATLHAARYYAIFPQPVIDALKTEGYYQYLGSPEFWNCGNLLYSTAIDKIDDLIAEGEKLGWIYQADDIAGLADAAGLPELEATVKEYDQMVADGEDTIFGKRVEMMQAVEGTGPYYLFQYNPGAFNTFGGCRTDMYTRALAADFSVIPGLYIAGVENGSLYSRPYYDVGGTCSGLAYSSGRLAGQQMAAYVQNA